MVCSGAKMSPLATCLPFLRASRKPDLKVILATNNATRTPEQCISKNWPALGVHLQKEQIITSAMGVAYLLKKTFPAGRTGLYDRRNRS